MADLATTVTVIDACGRTHVPVLLLSDPGMGKSSLVRGIAATEGVLCETVLGSIREPADVAGLPIIGEGGAVLDPPAWAKRLAEAGAGYLFLDELTACPPAVQAAMLAVALDRTVGDLRLPGGVRVVAGANPPDRAADGWEISPPLANRFCHVNYSPSVDEWLDGMTTGWAAPPASRAIGTDPARTAALVATVTGFVRTRPDLLHVFPGSAAATGGPWPSRRVWSMLAHALAHVRDDDHAAIQGVTFGLVGEGVGVEYLTWRQQADLPDPAAVVADPSIVAWGDRPDRVWAVLSGVVGWAAARGTTEAWKEAWGPLLAAAEHGAPDVAAAAARTLGRARPARASIPAAVRRFQPILVAAGLAEPTAAGAA
jgi:hypothetical protein